MSESTAGARRRRNPEQTRAAIIAALLEAIHDGELDPTGKRIAARAGVSERSVFVHFPGRDDLRIAVVEVQSERVEALIATPDPQLPLADRIDAVVRQSEAIFALQRNPRLLGLLESHTVPGVDARMRLTDRRIRDALARAFAPELTVDGGVGEELLDLVDAAVGWPTRHHLVDRRGRSQAEASAAIRRALFALLG
jgi:AcrR family transcriptional regulator